MSERGEAYFATYQPQRPDDRGSESSEPLLVRLARLEDLDGIAAVCHEREGGDYEAHRERFRKALAAESDFAAKPIFVAEIAGQLAGYGQIRYFTPPPDSPPNVASEGWYLAGLIVSLRFRRRGVGTALSRRRLEWIAERADEVFYFVNAQNRASLALHERLGFVEATRDFSYPGVSFSGGVGVLCRLMLKEGAL